MTRHEIAQYLAAVPPRIGDDVYCVVDPRHVGRLEGVYPTGCIVRWHETGWYSEGVPLSQLRKYDGS